MREYHATVEDYPGAENLDLAPPAVADAIREFLDQGLIERNPAVWANVLPADGQPTHRLQLYQATDQCHRFCEALCSHEWTTETPTTEGLYWCLQSDGRTDYVELSKAGRFSEQPDTLIVSETTEPLYSIIKNWGITHWCGPLQPPTPPA